jgi:hypothetical protein
VEKGKFFVYPYFVCYDDCPNNARDSAIFGGVSYLVLLPGTRTITVVCGTRYTYLYQVPRHFHVFYILSGVDFTFQQIQACFPGGSGSLAFLPYRKFVYTNSVRAIPSKEKLNKSTSDRNRNGELMIFLINNKHLYLN